MVNSPLVTQVNLNSYHLWLPTHGELKLPFVTRGEFIIPNTCGFATHGRNYTIPTPPPEGIAAVSQLLPPKMWIMLFMNCPKTPTSL
jgi:hypothetical protein